MTVLEFYTAEFLNSHLFYRFDAMIVVADCNCIIRKNSNVFVAKQH